MANRIFNQIHNKNKVNVNVFGFILVALKLCQLTGGSLLEHSSDDVSPINIELPTPITDAESNTSNATFQYDSSNRTVPDVKQLINWNEVDENFNKFLSDDEVIQKWDSMEANMRSGVRSLLRSVFPKVVSLSSDAKVSGNCSAGILKWIVSLRHMKSWAVKMLDATGKPPSGIFEGVVTMFGNYDECLKIRVFHDDNGADDGYYGEEESPDEPKEFFRGQYCVAEFKPWLPKKPHFYGMNSRLKTLFRDDDTVFSEYSKMAVFFHFLAFRMDLCVPSTCTRDDIQKVTTLMANLAEFRGRVLRCEVDSDHSPWSIISWFICIVIVTVLTVTFLGTTQDFSTLKLDRLNSKFLQMFSIKTNWKILTNSNEVTTMKLDVLYGARVLILLWIIVVHTFIIVDFQYFREMQTLKSWASKWLTQIFTNSLFQFDCFILISAFSFGYYNIDNANTQLFQYLFKRYLKLSILVLSMIVITLLTPSIIPRGPLTQDFVSKQTKSCQQYGWWNLLFMQNYFITNCLPHTWIFCVELQMMLLFAPLLVLYHSYSGHRLFKILFWLCLPLLLAAGFIYSFVQVYTHKFPPTYYWTLPDKEQRSEYFNSYYYKPWTHLSVYTIGFFVGIYRRLSNSKKKTMFNEQNVAYFGYLFSIFTITSFTFGFHDWVIGELPNEYISALYNSCQTISLSLAYSWILFAITDKTQENSQPVINKLLGSNLFFALGKLTLTGYLALPLVQTMLLSSQQQHLYSSTILMVYVIIGNIAFTYFLALCLTILVEIPSSLASSTFMNYLFKRRPEKNIEHICNNINIDNKAQDNGLPACSCPTNIELPICN